MLSLCHASFFGIGAYTVALLTQGRGFSFFLALPLSIVVTSICACLLAIVATRFRDDFFVLVTLAIQALIFSILYNWVELTRGTEGIPGIPEPTIVGIRISSGYSFAIFSALIVGFSTASIWKIIRSPFGRALQAGRDDRVLAASMGVNVRFVQIVAFSLSAGFAAISGGLYAVFFTFVEPETFALHMSVLILVAVVVGGAGTLRGPTIGAVILILLPELIRPIPLPSWAIANVHQVIYGLALIYLMVRRPSGIAGRFAFERS